MKCKIEAEELSCQRCYCHKVSSPGQPAGLNSSIQGSVRGFGYVRRRMIGEMESLREQGTGATMKKQYAVLRAAAPIGCSMNRAVIEVLRRVVSSCHGVSP